MKQCPKCLKEHERKGRFCSRKCANSRVWSLEDKKKKSVSALASPKHQKEMASRKILWAAKKELKHKCFACDEEVKGKRKFCSRTCFVEYKRSTNEAFVNYKLDCAFNFNVYDYPEEFNLRLIEEHGWYSASNRGNNFNGVSRDHRVSILYGFINGVPTEMMSHPANCELMQHGDNNRKKTKCSISIEELKTHINEWNKRNTVVTLYRKEGRLISGYEADRHRPLPPRLCRCS